MPLTPSPIHNIIPPALAPDAVGPPLLPLAPLPPHLAMPSPLDPAVGPARGLSPHTSWSLTIGGVIFGAAILFAGVVLFIAWWRSRTRKHPVRQQQRQLTVDSSRTH